MELAIPVSTREFPWVLFSIIFASQQAPPDLAVVPPVGGIHRNDTMHSKMARAPLCASVFRTYHAAGGTEE
jgi:hypothetical protein